MTHDADTVAMARAIRVEDEIARRGIRLRGKSERVGPCPICGGTDRFSINTRKQVFNCRGFGGGDVIAMVQHLDGCSFAEAARTLASIEPSRSAPMANPVKMAEVLAKAERDEADRLADDARRFMQAMTIWSEAVRIEATPTEVYLRIHRRLDLPDELSGPVLRFHPRCPFGDTHSPSLIALVRNIITDEPQAIVRTALNPDGTAVKVDGKTVRKALGPIGGGAVKLTDNVEMTTCLGVGEGIETVLSMRSTAEFGRSPVWALISSSGVASFPVLAGIECLWIAVDNDKPDQRGRQAGNEAALACSKRWTAAGREVYRVTPKRVGRDLDDVMRNRAASVTPENRRSEDGAPISAREGKNIFM
jgi:putative DNA primase/helicase